MDVAVNANGSSTWTLSAAEVPRLSALLGARVSGVTLEPQTSFTLTAARTRALADYLAWAEGGAYEITDAAVAVRDGDALTRRQHRPRICDALDAALGVTRE